MIPFVEFRMDRDTNKLLDYDVEHNLEQNLQDGFLDLDISTNTLKRTIDVDGVTKTTTEKLMIDLNEYLDKTRNLPKNFDISKDEIELMKDQGIPYGEQVKAQDSGIMQMADRDPLLEDEYNKYRFDMLEQGLEPMDFDSFRREAMSDQAAIDPKIRIEEVVKEFIREKGRKPKSLDELKEFFEMRMGTAKDPGMEVVKELVEDDKTRITLAGGSFPDLSGDGEITQEDILIGRGVIKRDNKQSGGLAAILGV